MNDTKFNYTKNHMLYYKLHCYYPKQHIVEYNA